jgi:hypothetical protein
MAIQEHLDILAQGPEVWNEWREGDASIVPNLYEAQLGGANLIRANLVGAMMIGANLDDAELDNANLAGADLRGAKLFGANLIGANLVGAMLIDAYMDNTNLEGTDLESANLQGANLVRANLASASLRGANLGGANLDRAILGGADLDGARVGNTYFANVDLSQAHGLDCVNHFGPSTIGLDTIYRSGGKIPEVFLRGCGVPENFITYMHSLTGAAFEFYSCFISHSTKDQAFANRLHADLQAKGVRCWFAPHELKGGKKLHEQIDEAIRVYDKLLLILSGASMNSEWVATEISKARKRERKENRKMLFPISLAPFETIRDWECFDADAGKDSAHEIREYFVPDFSNWKNHDSYTVAFERLVRDLKAEPAT